MARRPKKRIFQIILTSRGKMLRTICTAETEKNIYKRFDALLEENKSVVFPIRHLNCEKIVPAQYELYIIKRKDKADKELTPLKDENGKIIDYGTSDEDWVIYDRADYDMEESFWVYGYHPIYQRKDFNWIWENLIKTGSNDKYSYRQVMVFKNKLLIDSGTKLDMVLCKNVSDCIRLYNELEERKKKEKLKNIVFSGDYSKSRLRKEIYQRLIDLTNWPLRKLNRNSLRP